MASYKLNPLHIDNKENKENAYKLVAVKSFENTTIQCSCFWP